MTTTPNSKLRTNATHPDKSSKLPLQGVKVLDLSRVLAGPYCTMLLGDLGADVLKVEMPGEGDDTRRWGPPYVSGESAYYLSVNRNKRGITLNIKSATGQRILRQLVERSHVLVENFKPGTLQRLDLGYEQLRDLKPALVYCRISGYGASGPDANLPGYDFVLQAASGLMSISGAAEGEPMKLGVAIVDILTGLFAANGIQAALRAAEATGRGQLVDISLLESALAVLINVGQGYLVTGNPPERHGNAHANIAPYEVYRAANGYIAIGCGNDRQFAALCATLGDPGLASDPDFATNPARVANRPALKAKLETLLTAHSVTDWIPLIRAAGIPAGPINDIPTILNDPQSAARDMVQEVAHPTIENLRMVGIPLKFSVADPTIRRPPPPV
jgi:crotonobetainyl-CoA:carnitine CoA-transferase CaiB-like acyl-CoA transferase